MKLLCMPWKWKTGNDRTKLKTALQSHFDVDAFLFATGRDALLALLRSLDLEPGSEVIVQGYTCAVLPNAIHAAKLTPVFADIDPNTLNIDPAQIEKVINNRTRAIIVQHTFGIAANMQKLKAIAQQHNVILIEDCAHILPDSTGPQQIGVHADFLMLSFGRDKAISGITGGAILSKHADVSDRLKQEEANAKELGLLSIKRLLFYPLIYAIAKPLYGIGTGKALLWIAAKLKLLAPVLTKNEKLGFTDLTLHRMPNACCALARKQLQNLHILNDHRRDVAKLYKDAAETHQWNTPNDIDLNLPLQKFPLFVRDADRIRSTLKRRNIYLDDGWTGAVVCPRAVDQEATGYERGTCPNAEKVAKQILSLPTHPTMTVKQVHRLISIMQNII